MSIIDKTKLEELGKLLAANHKRYGKVAPRKPYRKDDEGGDTGVAELSPFEQHPLLAEQPVGAPSDLTAIVTENSEAEGEAEKRDASPELTKRLQLANSHKHTHGYSAVPTASPY